LNQELRRVARVNLDIGKRRLVVIEAVGKLGGEAVADAEVRETKELLDVGEEAARLVNVVRDVSSAGVRKDDLGDAEAQTYLVDLGRIDVTASMHTASI
jgi:hypothetical protein